MIKCISTNRLSHTALIYVLAVQQKYVRPLLGCIIGCVQHDYV